MWSHLMLKLRESLWWPPALASMFSIAMAAAAFWLGDLIPGELDFTISEESLVSLLAIFATSMLTVSTFTLSSIVTAASGVAQTATPRASRFVLNDPRAQTVLSAFIAAFIYSVVSILALKAFAYGSGGRFLLFGGLIVLVTIVLIAFIQWVGAVLTLGRQQTIIDRLGEMARESASSDRAGNMGATVWDGRLPKGAQAIQPTEFGYISSIDIEALQAIAEDADGKIILPMRTGDFADLGYPVAYFDGEALGDERAGKIRDKIALFTMRNERHDLRFNITNLSEVADRALSPGVNDPGTAIIVIDVLRSVLHRWSSERSDAAQDEPASDRVAIVGLSADELLDQAFTKIARDGAGFVEVASRLQDTLASLALSGDQELAKAAKAMSDVALKQAKEAITLDKHRRQVERLARRVGAGS